MDSPSTQETTNSTSTSPPGDMSARNAFESESKLMSCIRFLISNAAAGSVIGKGGSTINEFQMQSGAKIQLSRNREYFPGTTDRVTAISGSTSEILRAFNLILFKIQHEIPNEIDPKANQVRLIVPHNVCGAIIGKGGATIRSLVEESQANIKLSSPESTFPGLRDRLVTITGTYEQQSRAVALIIEKISEDANYVQYASAPMLYTGKDILGMQCLQAPFPNASSIAPLGYGVSPYAFYGVKGVPAPFPTTVRGSPVHISSLPGISATVPSTSCIIAIPDDHIGVILGRGGKTISDIQQMSGVRIKVSERGDFVPGTTDRKVTITGSPECIYVANQMLVQKIQQTYSEMGR